MTKILKEIPNLTDSSSEGLFNDTLDLTDLSSEELLNDTPDLINLSSEDLNELTEKVQLSLKTTIAYFIKYANHTSDPKILMNYVHEEFTKLKIMSPFISAYGYNWRNNIYSDALYSLKEKVVDINELDFKPLFSIIEITFDLNTDVYTLDFKFRKEMFANELLFNQMNLSYDTKQFHWSYCYDDNVVYKFERK